jgi:serine/threonine-protein kinase
MALSPDGQHLVYVGRQGDREVIYHQAMDQLQPDSINGTDGAHGLFFSPDSQWVGFHADGKLKKVSPEGGSPQTICDVNEMLGASWGQDGNIIFGDGTSGLYQVPAGGGTPQRLTTPSDGDGEAGHRWPEILPGGQAALFTVWTGGFYNADRIGVLSLETGEWRVLVEGGSSPRYSPTGHLTYVRSDMLMAAPFDLTSLEVTGEPIAVLEELSVNIGGVSHLAFAEDGSLVYLSIQEATDRKLVWVDREGSESLLTEERRTYATPRISPDGSRIAFCVYEGGMPDSVWIYDTEDDFFRRMTFEGETRDCAPVWSPDGEWIAFQSTREGERRIYRQLADRSGPEELLLSSPFLQVPTGWSPDGSVFTYFEARPESSYDIWSISTDSDSEPQILLATPDYDCCSAFSPDGRWMAYVSGDMSRTQIFVRPFPGSGVTQLVSGEEGGGEPIWSADGTELFYRAEGKTMVVSIETEPGFRAGRPRVLFEGPYVSSSITPGFPYYDVTPDGYPERRGNSPNQRRSQLVRRTEAISPYRPIR